MEHISSLLFRILKIKIWAKSTSLAIASLTLGVMSSPSISLTSEQIKIKSISIFSTIAEIELVFGECGKQEQDGWHYCGGSDSNAFKLREDGSIEQISFECELINACEYPASVLAEMLLENMPTVISKETNEWALGKIITLYGRAGDILTIQTFDEDSTNAYISLSSKSALDLD